MKNLNTFKVVGEVTELRGFSDNYPNKTAQVKLTRNMRDGEVVFSKVIISVDCKGSELLEVGKKFVFSGNLHIRHENGFWLRARSITEFREDRDQD